jgi:hypothetical protein
MELLDMYVTVPMEHVHLLMMFSGTWKQLVSQPPVFNSTINSPWRRKHVPLVSTEITRTFDPSTGTSFKNLTKVSSYAKKSHCFHKNGVSRSWSSINTGLNWPLFLSRTVGLNFCDRNSEFPGHTLLLCYRDLFLPHMFSFTGEREEPNSG